MLLPSMKNAGFAGVSENPILLLRPKNC